MCHRTEFLDNDNPARELDRLLNNIWEHERVESALREKEDELRRTQEILVADISQRKRAEEELRRSETYLAEGQRLSHTGSWARNVCLRRGLLVAGNFSHLCL